MGRVSKRKATLLRQTSLQGKRYYKVGIYARLSSDNNEKKKESIEVQIKMAKKFVEEFNEKHNEERMDIAECYIDLGKTGSHFNREGFRKLMQDIRLGDINCVIVKDLSRFGRNYLEAGNYIEKIFPFLGVRFIAIADGYDTGKKGNETKQMASEIKNLINDMYAKDFSKKAKIHLKQQREEGSYTGGPPPYGYLSQWEGKKRKLVPDENTSSIVSLIYHLFIEKENYTKVTNELNKRKINPPAVYKKKREVYYSGNDSTYKGWDRSSVERILQNQTYIGTLVQGKTSIIARNEKNRKYKPQEEWVMRKAVHEALIDEETYHIVQKVRNKLQKRIEFRNPSTEDCAVEEDIFKKVLYCGVCGRKMTRKSNKRTHKNGAKTRLDSYFCLNGGQTKVLVCPRTNHISKRELIDILLPFIRTEFALYLKKAKYYEDYGKKIIEEEKKESRRKQRELEKKWRQSIEKEGNLYIDYYEGRISQKDYTAYKIQIETRRLELKKQKEQQETERKNIEKKSVEYLAAIHSLLGLKSEKEITKEVIESFIEKIYVYPEKRIEVIFTFVMAYRKEGK